MNNLGPDAHHAPLFRPAEFREYQPPKIPLPRRNYTPQQGIITMTGTQTSAARPRPIVDLSEADLKKGRAVSHAKRLGKAADPASTQQRILRLLRLAREALTSAEIAAALGLDPCAISSRIGAYRKLHPDHIETIKQPKTNYRQYRWTGPEESAP